MNPKHILLVGAAVSVLVFFTGCQSSSPKTTTAATPAPPAAPAAAATPAPAPAAAAPDVTAVPATAPMAIRIKAGLSTSLTNSDGTVWLPDQNFADGETVERPDIQVANTTEPEIYKSEHYSMTSFSRPVPNGKYTVKLHFAETYEGITDKGQRVFSVNVQGQDIKDLDVFDKAGGALRAYVVTVPVEVTNGKLDITFTANIENPEINGIEIIPNP
jgi:endoglucanase